MERRAVAGVEPAELMEEETGAQGMA